MANTEALTKRVALSKANAQVVAIVAVASFVTVFCLIAAKTVLSQNSYNSRVISAENIANNQLKANLTAFNSLSSNYYNFVNSNTNVLGGQSNNTTANNGGSNSKIILDALPPTYDFPALASSVEAILKSQGLTISGIGGTDNQLTEQTNNTSPSPTPVSMPFSFTINDLNYQAVGALLDTLQKSVRPIAVDSISLNGGGSNISLSVQAHTYYQPAKSLGIKEQAVL
ncbi:MAG TPA: hypothetical protein VFN31_00175 [Candidatus Saccharimonadales bacterium]|nr:hypothetical protein [Candidatus Saccharimonadales bacterium]